MLSALVISALVASAASAPLLAAPKDRSIKGQYIVRLDSRKSLAQLRAHVDEIRGSLGDNFESRHIYENLAGFNTVGYSAKLTQKGVDFLLNHEAVSFIEEDQEKFLVTKFGDTCEHQSDPDWGLARTNHRDYNSRSNYTYDYTDGATGAGIDAYVIDTGIYCENDDFTSKKVGSCSFGATFVDPLIGPPDETDGNGHGTHCAGTIGGQTYGVAKEVDLIAVKVMSDRGSGSSSDILAGIDWVVGAAKKSRKPSVANLSIGGGFSQTENDAIEDATDAGIVMNVAAGNEDSDACDTSPASAPSAITVGATDDDNSRASYSNYGSCLDIFGPGTDITSAWIGSPSATNTISGTSMATPHVTGVAAKMRSADPSLSVAEITKKMLSDASEGEVTDLKGSPNLMVYAACE